MWKGVFSIAVVGWLGFTMVSSVGIERPAGVLVRGTPDQRDLGGQASIEHRGYTLTSLAEFSLEARVLSEKDYWMGRESELAPVDLALGWDRMSDSAVIDRLDIDQSSRFYWYRWGPEGPPIPQSEIIRSSSNMHLIPANDAVESRIEAARRGHIVRLRGKLVRAAAPDGWRWNSSLTREDSGNGACELVLVESFEIVR